MVCFITGDAHVYESVNAADNKDKRTGNIMILYNIFHLMIVKHVDVV